LITLYLVPAAFVVLDRLRRGRRTPSARPVDDVRRRDVEARAVATHAASVEVH